MSAANTYREMQDRVLSMVSKNDAVTRARVKISLNLGLKHFVTRELWPFRETTGTLATIASTQEYSLVSNFSDIDLQNIIAVTLQGATNKKLTYIPYNQLRASQPDFDLVGASVPVQYYLKGGSIGFWPLPAAVYTAFIDYYKLATEMSGDTDEPIIPITYREALVKYALAEEHAFNNDPDLQTLANNEYENIVTLARQNLLAQPTDTGGFTILGPMDFKNPTDIQSGVW